MVGFEELSASDWFALQFFLTYLREIFSKSPPEEFHDYDDLLVRELPPTKYLFRPEESKYVIIVGTVEEKWIKAFLDSLFKFKE